MQSNDNNKNRGAHGDSSFMLGGVPSSSENPPALAVWECQVVNTLFTDEWYNPTNMHNRGVVQIPLCFLAKSLENMSLCHAVLFCKGWENARGCKIEHEAAAAYGLEMMYEM